MIWFIADYQESARDGRTQIPSAYGGDVFIVRKKIFKKLSANLKISPRHYWQLCVDKDQNYLRRLPILFFSFLFLEVDDNKIDQVKIVFWKPPTALAREMTGCEDRRKCWPVVLIRHLHSSPPV